MHRSHVPIQEWFWAAYLVSTHTPGIIGGRRPKYSSEQVAQVDLRDV